MIEIEQLLALLSYDPATGLATWRVSRRGHIRSGKEAGTINFHGYRCVMLQGRTYMTHRIAWAIAHGAWPTGDIDHIDGCRTNNRIENLRDVSKSTNMQNLKRANRTNLSDSSVPGVGWDKRGGKFRVRAQRNGHEVQIGQFATLAEAEAASIAYRREHYEGFML